MNLSGRRRLVGITNQLAGGVIGYFELTWYAVDGTTVINATGLLVPLSGSLKHSANLKTLTDFHGNEVSVIATNEKITAEFVCVPDAAALAGGNAATALADVIQAATLPAPNGWLTIRNGVASIDGRSHPSANANPLTIPMGSFADAFNSDNWMYNSDGSLEFGADGEWGVRFTATRRIALARTAAVAV